MTSFKVIINIFAKNPPTICFAVSAILYILAFLYSATPFPDKDPTMPSALMGYAWQIFVAGCLLQILYMLWRFYATKK